MTRRWLQIKGDPSIRRFLFSQERQISVLDGRYDVVMDRAMKLFRERGLFHIKIHFSSAQVTLWLLDDPCNYRVTMIDEFIDPNLMGKFAYQTYPKTAIIRPDEIPLVLTRFKELRYSDETVYLRSASLNIMNGSVGLNFSCDGSHYIDYRAFLESQQYQPA